MEITQYKPSVYQQAVYDEFDNTKNNILISAVAGSGKSSTLKDLIKRTFVPTTFLAFNKSIQKEMSDKIGGRPNVDVLTMHSLGMKAIMRYYGTRLTVNENKAWKLMTEINSTHWKLNKKEFAKNAMIVSQLIDLYRMTLCTNIDDLKKQANALGIDYKKQQLYYTIDLFNAYTEYNINPTEIDFTDMIYIPASNKDVRLTVKPKLILIDECQDLNACQHALVDRLINENSARFIAVGDPYQAIYGFAGAHSRSFYLFEEKMNTVMMPLSICYRCPKLVIEEANDVYDILEHWEGNGDGLVIQQGNSSGASTGDLIICRNLKPLIEVYFSLIIRGTKAYIKGKDLGKGLVNLLNDYKGLSTDIMNIRLVERLIEKRNELIEEGIENPTNHFSYTSLEDKIDILAFLSTKFDQVNHMISFLEKMFSDSQEQGVILCTIHKAKGLEADNVFFLQKSLIPSKFATTPEALKQEKNLLYVALTRAKKKLIYIED